MFDINEHTALHSGKSLQQANQKVANLAATATLTLTKLTASILQKLIQSIINRLRSQQDSSIEIKINNLVVFKGKVGEKPSINKLSLNNLTAILESAIADSKQNLELLVKADNKIVYESNRGKVKLNQIASFLQAAKDLNSHKTSSSQLETQTRDNELESNSLLAILSAKQLLDKLQTNEYENQNYLLRREGNNITVSAKNGRGEIARLQTGRITSKNLSYCDIASLIDLVDRLDLQSSTIEPKPPIKTPQEYLQNYVYTMRREGNKIIVGANDSRGEIARLETGPLTSKNLNNFDVASLIDLVEHLDLQLSKIEPKPPVKPRQDYVYTANSQEEEVER